MRRRTEDLQYLYQPAHRLYVGGNPRIPADSVNLGLCPACSASIYVRSRTGSPLGISGQGFPPIPPVCPCCGADMRGRASC